METPINPASTLSRNRVLKLAGMFCVELINFSQMIAQAIKANGFYGKFWQEYSQLRLSGELYDQNSNLVV